MTTKEAVEILTESRRQNQIMLENPTLFFLNDPAGQLEQVKHTRDRIEALTIAIDLLSTH